MHNQIVKFKCEFAKINTIFGENHFYYNHNQDYMNGGIDDGLLNQFYIRPISSFKLAGKLPILIQSGKFRAVFQLSNKVDRNIAFGSILNQLQANVNINISSYNDDNVAIVQQETGQDKEMQGINLYSFDFDFNIEFVPTFCNCLTMNLC